MEQKTYIIKLYVKDTCWFNENDDLYYAWDIKQKKNG